MKIKLLTLLALLALSCTSTDYELKVDNDKVLTPYLADEAGVAIGGYDPAAYFIQGKPLMGLEEYSYEWDGVLWYFASPGNREVFIDSPEKYSPMYGGYCAYAVAYSADLPPAPGNPHHWSIVKGKLYLNYNGFINFIWGFDKDKNILNAERMWPPKKKILESAD